MDTEESKKVAELREQLSKALDLLEEEKKANKRLKNNDFVQVQRREMRALAALGAKSPLALDLLMVMAQSMNRQNAVMLSFKAMQHIMGKSRPTIDRAIRLLRDDRWLQVVKVGTANAYVLNECVFWTDTKDKRPMATFSAQVITTLEEQDKDLRQNREVKLNRVPQLTTAGERVVLNDEVLPPPDQQDLELN